MTLGVIILAAGQGKRMRSSKAKVLHKLGGKPLLARVLDTAEQLGSDRTVVVYGHGGEQVRSAMADRDCCWVEQTERLGTGHAVTQALPETTSMDRVLILYGDVPLIGADTLRRLIEASARHALGVLTAQIEDPTGYGRIIRDPVSGEITRNVEQKDATTDELSVCEINTGFLVADRARLRDWLARITNDNAQGEYYLTDVIALAVGDGHKVASAQAGTIEEVSGINDRVQLAALERFYQRTVAESLMRAGVSLADPNRIDVRGSLTAGQDVFIDINLVVDGTVQLGSRVSVGANCVIRDAKIADDVVIHAGCVIEGATIGPGSKVGPFARLRPEARLAAGTHVGNFVEIKKSIVGEGSKINHLTYIGDAEIGANVNIGAGTITCNYDGANKHRTQIGDRAFIGSNTALVAPVRVGTNATIGAGSVITSDAPEDALTLARGRQVTIGGWTRPVKKQPKP